MRSGMETMFLEKHRVGADWLLALTYYDNLCNVHVLSERVCVMDLCGHINVTD